MRPHALLHDRPFTVRGQEETVVVNPEPVLHRGGIHFRRHAAVIGETVAVHVETRPDLP